MSATAGPSAPARAEPAADHSRRALLLLWLALAAAPHLHLRHAGVDRDNRWGDHALAFHSARVRQPQDPPSDGQPRNPGFELTLIGLVACRLALTRNRPLTAWGWALVATLLLLFSVDRIVGPLSQPSGDVVRGIAAFPVLAVQAPFQHTMRIYQQWNLNRSKGTARYLGLQHDARNWLPAPVLPAAAAFVAARTLGAAEPAAWTVAGTVFGIGSLLWDPTSC